MFGTYLRRELVNRKRQTVIVACGMAFAIALVMTVSAVSTGVRNSQDQVLGSLYGIGTDISVTQTAQPGDGDGSPRFEFGADAGTTADGSRTINSTRLEVQRFSTFTADQVRSVGAAGGVATVATSLLLNNTTFKGELPKFQFGGGDGNGDGGPGGFPGQNQQGGTTNSTMPQVTPTAPANPVQTTIVGAAYVTATTVQAPTGGSDGKGGSSFQVTSFSVMGADPSIKDAGPLSATKVVDGRALSASDKGKKYAVLDSAYATTEELEVGDTIKIAKKSFEIVGTVTSNSSAAETAANVFIPLDVAQTLADKAGLVTNIYVKAVNGDSVDTVAAAIKAALPEATVSTTAELAKSVSGSLSTASDLLGTLGRWLSIIVLVVAFVVATLFTIGGVSRRTREFGTLKAIGWRNNRIVRQVAGESVVNGAVGGVFGVGLGYAAIAVFNMVAPKLEASTAGLGNTRPGGFGGGAFGPPDGGPFGGGAMNGSVPGNRVGGFAGRFGQAANNSYEVVLKAATKPSMIITAVALAVLGGVIAGVFGGMRAARLRPAEAMRSVA